MLKNDGDIGDISPIDKRAFSLQEFILSIVKKYFYHISEATNMPSVYIRSYI